MSFTGEHSGTTLELNEETVLTFCFEWANGTTPQRFLGWYVGDTLIPTEQNFTSRYSVNKSQTIVARVEFNNDAYI